MSFSVIFLIIRFFFLLGDELHFPVKLKISDNINIDFLLPRNNYKNGVVIVSVLAH